MCADMELEDEDVKDFIQRQRLQWKELARLPERIDIVVDKLLAHFLAYPDPGGFKAQLVAVDRRACARYKDALDAKLKARELPPEWSDVIISAGQNDDADLARFHYGKQQQDDLIDYFKLTPQQWEGWNRERHGEDRSRWRPPLKILIVCDRLLTGFDAPVEQVMYLDKPLRDHNLLQAIARTNRPMPAMNKRTGVVVDYFGVFANLEKALNFDENIREESLIDWDRLKATVPGEMECCLESFAGIQIEDTRACLLAALGRLRDAEAAKLFEQNFKSLSRLWEAVSPDPCLYGQRFAYNWLCGIYVAYRRRKNGKGKGAHHELSAKTRKLIEENTTFLDIAEALPVFKIDQGYVTQLEELPTAADKAAALEAMLTAELTEGGQGDPVYRKLGERLQNIKQRKDAGDKATEARLKELRDAADALMDFKAMVARLNLTEPGEYELFTVLREYAATQDENYLADCARLMVEHLGNHRLLAQGWSGSKQGRMQVEQSLLAASWHPAYARLGFDAGNPEPPFLVPAVAELAKCDG